MFAFLFIIMSNVLGLINLQYTTIKLFKTIYSDFAIEVERFMAFDLTKI